MSSVVLLTSVAQQLNIYFGSFLYIFGTLGSVLVILIFVQKSLRTSPCSIYLLAAVFADFIQLNFILLTRIFADGLKMDPSSTNLIWCKLRTYIGQCASLTSLTCLVIASIDRYCSTSRNARKREFSKISVAKCNIIIIVLFWLLTSLPVPIIYQIQNNVCSPQSPGYIIYGIYVLNLLFYGFLPVMLMIIFGLLTVKNLQTLRHRIVPLQQHQQRPTFKQHMDEQLTSMLLLQILICILSSVPSAIQRLYANITSTVLKESLRQAWENLASQIVRLLFHLNYSSSFYVYYVSSSIFRKKIKRLILYKRLIDRISNTDGRIHQQQHSIAPTINANTNQQQPQAFTN